MLLDFEIDYFKYDNCYPRLDGSTKCYGSGMGQNKSFSYGKLKGCDDGCNQYVDLRSSIQHFPSFWQDPSEENR